MPFLDSYLLRVEHTKARRAGTFSLHWIHAFYLSYECYWGIFNLSGVGPKVFHIMQRLMFPVLCPVLFSSKLPAGPLFGV